MAILSGIACRGARGLLRWQMRDLAKASGVSLPTILKLESGGRVSEDTAGKIAGAFAAHGVELVDTPERAGAFATLASFRPNPKKARRG